MAESEAKRFENWWNNMISGVRNAFKTKILNAKSIEPVVVGEGLESLQDTGLTQQKREDIATALGVPQTKLFSSGAGGLGGGDRVVACSWPKRGRLGPWRSRRRRKLQRRPLKC